MLIKMITVIFSSILSICIYLRKVNSDFSLTRNQSLENSHIKGYISKVCLRSSQNHNNVGLVLSI